MAHQASSPLRMRGALFLVAAFVLWSAWGAPLDSGTLWIAESNGVLNLSADTGAQRFEIVHPLGVDAVAVNDIDGTAWAYGKKRLHHYARDGALLHSVDTPPLTLGGAPTEFLVDGAAGNVWLVIRREAYRFDFTGQLVQTLTLSRDAIAAALERERSRLWLAHDDAIAVYDADGVVQKTLDLRPARIVDVAYDRHRQEFWVSCADRIRRYDVHGKLVFEIAMPGGAIAPDGAGGLWLLRGERLAHVDDSGVETVRVTPFTDGLDRLLVDLAANPYDASVWVASPRRLAHYAIDGQRLGVVDVNTSGGGVRKLFRAAAYADLDPPELQVLEPSTGALLAAPRPVIRLSYFDLGVGVDPDSIRLTLDGATLLAACEATGAGATCVPSAPVPDGAHVLAASVADLAGNRSQAVTASFTIDTMPPVVTVTHPPADFVTNQPLLGLHGALNEPGTVALDGVVLGIDDDLRFRADKELTEGANTFHFAATDRAGNTGGTTVTVVLDTAPPAAPRTDGVDVVVQGADAMVTGRPGTAEAGSTVHVRNLRTGAVGLAVVAADGSFQVTIAASGGDELSLTVVDAAGNTSSALTRKLASAFALTIAEPAPGATVPRPNVLVTGTLSGPWNTALSVNGVPATVLPRPDGLDFFATVALAPGENTLTAVATTQSGATTQASVVVTRTTGAFSFAADAPMGAAPLAVKLSLTGDLGLNDQSRIDFDGDGIYDASSGSLNGLTKVFTYGAPGRYTARAQVRRYHVPTGQHMTVFEQTLPVVVLDGAALERHADAVLRGVWRGMNEALIAGDVPRALTALTFDSRPLYEEAFTALLPNMGAILGDFTDVEPLAATDTYAEYLIMNVRNSQTRVHVIGFVKGTDGVWRIDQL